MPGIARTAHRDRDYVYAIVSEHVGQPGEPTACIPQDDGKFLRFYPSMEECVINISTFFNQFARTIPFFAHPDSFCRGWMCCEQHPPEPWRIIMHEVDVAQSFFT